VDLASADIENDFWWSTRLNPGSIPHSNSRWKGTRSADRNEDRAPSTLSELRHRNLREDDGLGIREHHQPDQARTEPDLFARAPPAVE